MTKSSKHLVISNPNPSCSLEWSQNGGQTSWKFDVRLWKSGGEWEEGISGRILTLQPADDSVSLPCFGWQGKGSCHARRRHKCSNYNNLRQPKVVCQCRNLRELRTQPGRHAASALPDIHSPKLNQRVVVTFCCVKNWIAVLAHSAAGEVLEMLLQ